MTEFFRHYSTFLMKGNPMYISQDKAVKVIEKEAEKAEILKDYYFEIARSFQYLFGAMRAEQTESKFITERNEKTNANTLAIIEKQGAFFEPQLTSLPDKMSRIY